MVGEAGKMVRFSECLSYQGFELSSDFFEKVLVKVQRELKNSSSYWKFEFIGGSSYSQECTVVYISLLLIITLPFTCGERKICSTIKKSQNIMHMIVDQFEYVEFDGDFHFILFFYFFTFFRLESFLG